MTEQLGAKPQVLESIFDEEEDESVMTIEAKARRIRALAEEMAAVLSTGPKVCALALRLEDGMVIAVEAQMEPFIGEDLGELGPVQTSKPHPHPHSGSWWVERSVTASGVKFWTHSSAPIPVQEPVHI